MQSRQILFPIVISIAMSMLLASTALAGTLVKQLDADTISVLQLKGKPPHKRFTVSRDQGATYAYYADRIDHKPQPLLISERRKVPGKNLPSKVLSVTTDRSEIVEFSRFEETASESPTPGRLWRGAPGKGRAFNR